MECSFGKAHEMTVTTNALTTLTFVAPNQSEGRGEEAYRLAKSFATVQFDQAAKGRIVYLQEGAELRVVGLSRVEGCLEVLCKGQIYSMFEIDLLGPWSQRIERRPLKSRRIKPGQTSLAVGACA